MCSCKFFATAAAGDAIQKDALMLSEVKFNTVPFLMRNHSQSEGEAAQRKELQSTTNSGKCENVCMLLKDSVNPNYNLLIYFNSVHQAKMREIAWSS